MCCFDFSTLSFFDVLPVSGNNTPLTIVVVMQLRFANSKLLTINLKTALVLAGFGKVCFSPHSDSLTDLCHKAVPLVDFSTFLLILGIFIN